MPDPTFPDGMEVEVLHHLALALIEVLEGIQGAATKGVAEYKENRTLIEMEKTLYPNAPNMTKIMDEIHIGDKCISRAACNAPNFKAFATAHNTQPALLGIVKGQLEQIYGEYERWHRVKPNGFESWFIDEQIGYYAELLDNLYRQLCTMSVECPELAALREAMEEN